MHRFLLACTCSCLLCGCQTSQATDGARAPTPWPEAFPAAESLPPSTDPHAELDNRASLPELREKSQGVDLTILTVLVPQRHRDRLARVWRQVSDEALDEATRLQLRRNGLRVAVGHARFWPGIKDALSEIPDAAAQPLLPYRLPFGFPLTLELDNKPHDQNLFWVERDGVLSGRTWTDCRNVLSVVYGRDPANPDTLQVRIVPELRQEQNSWKFVRVGERVTRVPDNTAFAFYAAAVRLELDPQRFIIIGPGDRTDVPGLLGNVFLSRMWEDEPYDAIVVIYPDQRHGRE